jgi:purine nucleosidase
MIFPVYHDCACLTDYKHAQRRFARRSEPLEITPDELSIIRSLPITPVSPVLSPVSPLPCKLLIDTDIGTDVDDALALLYALRLPDVQIVGVTTNYAVTVIRAAVAKEIIKLHRQSRPSYPDIPVIAGSSRPLGTHRDYFLTGREGLPFLPDDFRESHWVPQMNQIEQTEAADFIAATVTANPGEITICGIGMLTNIALALTRHPSICTQIKEIVIMGCGAIISGENSPFEQPLKDGCLEFVKSGKIIHLYPNQNVSADVEASRIVFAQAKCPIRMVPSNLTMEFWLEGRPIDFLKGQSVQDSVSGAVGKLMLNWFAAKGRDQGQCPHDPLVINEARFRGEEGCLEYVRGRVVIHEWAAFGTFVPNEEGPHWLGVAVRGHDAFLERLVDVLTEPD